MARSRVVAAETKKTMLDRIWGGGEGGGKDYYLNIFFLPDADGTQLFLDLVYRR